MSVKQNGVPSDSRWKQIPEFPNYWVSQYGQVFNMKRHSLMSLHYNQHHVLSVRLYGTLNHTGSRGYFRSVAKLVQRLHGQPLQVSHERCSPWLGGWPMGVVGLPLLTTPAEK